MFFVGSLFGLCGLAENYDQFRMERRQTCGHLLGDYWGHVAIVQGTESEQEAGKSGGGGSRSAAVV